MMRNEKGQFVKGNEPHNKGKEREQWLEPSTIEKVEKTQFKKGQNAGEKSNNWKGGVQQMKNDCVYLYDGVNRRKRRPRAVYEEHYGKIPKGYIIWHKDGDKDNDDPKNLEAISRGECMKRNSRR